MNDAMKLIANRVRLVGATGQYGNETVPSPCNSVCRMEVATGWCEGCLRTLDEIAAWGMQDDQARRAVWQRIAQRMASRTAAATASPGQA